MKILFDFDPAKCSACGACAIACMDQNDVDVEHGQQPYRKVYLYESGSELASVSIACLHCPDAPCVTACPVGCLYKDLSNGLTRYDTTNCIGCHSCAMACPFGAPKFDPQGKIVKCDGCADRVRRGYPPACVRVCPTGALTLRTEEEQRRQNQAHLLRHVLQLTEDA